jgi:hypothetical protein
MRSTSLRRTSILACGVFDDPRVGLNQEPFVAGADAMIDRVVADVPNAEHGFTLIRRLALPRSPAPARLGAC